MQEDQRKEKLKLRARRYRAKHVVKVRAYDRARWLVKRGEERRVKRFEDRYCKMCDIPLSAPVHGGKGTRVYCISCSGNRKLQVKLNMRRLRARKRKRKVVV